MLYAKGLVALGLKRGDEVCMFGCQGSDGVVMFVACSSLGIKCTVSSAQRNVHQMKLFSAHHKSSLSFKNFRDARDPKWLFIDLELLKLRASRILLGCLLVTSCIPHCYRQ